MRSKEIYIERHTRYKVHSISVEAVKKTEQKFVVHDLQITYDKRESNNDE